MSYAESLTFEPWSIDYHKAMASTGEVCESVKNSTNIFQLVKKLWSLDRIFKRLVSILGEAKTIDHDELLKVVSRIEELHEKTTYVLQLCKKKGLTNRTFTGASLRSIEAGNCRLDSFIETFRLSLDSEIQQQISDSWNEYQRGEKVSLDSLL